VKAEIEDIPKEVCRLPYGNRGIEVTSESEEERKLLETMWSRSPAAVVFTRNNDGSVTLIIGPTKPEG
jgi:hypothetical protein